MARERAEPTKEAGKPVAVELPSEVIDGPFKAKVSTPDENTIVVTIKREDKGLAYQVRFEVVRIGRGRFIPSVRVLRVDEGGEAVMVGGPGVSGLVTLFNLLGNLLHTNKRDLVVITRLLNQINELVREGAKRREREYRRRIVEEHYQEALQEPGLKEDTPCGMP